MDRGDTFAKEYLCNSKTKRAEDKGMLCIDEIIRQSRRGLSEGGEDADRGVDEVNLNLSAKSDMFKLVTCNISRIRFGVGYVVDDST